MAIRKIKDIVLRLVTILVFLVLLCASSYALWNYTYEGSNNLMQKQAIEIEFLESSDVINLTNAVPISDKEGMVQNEAFDFQVRTKTKSNMSIGYNIVLEKVEIEDEYTVLNDNQVKIYLTDMNNKGLIDPTLVSDLEDYKIYKKYHRHNKEKEEVISKYRIRMWMDESVTGEGWDENTKIAYSFKLGVKAVEGETYDVVFNSNNGTGEEKVQHIAYNEELELEKNTFTKAGYRFIGWSMTPTGSVVYQDRQKVKNLSGENESITLYAVWEVSIFDVEVVVQNGIIEDEVSKRVNYKEEEVFKLKPNSVDAPATVSCTNSQIGNIKYNKLTVSNVTKDTVCTVVYAKDMTTLYSDGTLIINEYARDRKDNIEKHGSVTKEYEGMSESNSYVMTSHSSQPWANERTSIIDVELGQEISPVSTAHWFREVRNMEEGDFTKLNTSQVVDMQYMFNYSGYSASTYNLTGLDTWDTSKVTNMKKLFDHAGYTTTTSYNIGDLSRWNVSSVTTMNRMFASSCRNASVCDIGNIGKWNVSNVVDMEGMFTYYATTTKNFNIGDIGEWNVSNVKKINSMFEAAALRSEEFVLDLSKWDVSSVTSMGGMFLSAGAYSKIFNLVKLDNWDVSNVTSMSNMFGNSGSNATTWNIGDLSKWNTSKVTTMYYMFGRVGNLATTFPSIGTLNIPEGCNVNNFAYSTDISIGTRKLTGNFVINGSLSSYADMLRDTATDSSARINLYYKNAEAEAIVDELISLYGPTGTVSQGNIYKVTE